VLPLRCCVALLGSRGAGPCAALLRCLLVRACLGGVCQMSRTVICRETPGCLPLQLGLGETQMLDKILYEEEVRLSLIER